VKRLSSWALPILLGVAGVALIIIGSIRPTAPTASLPPIATPTPVAQASPTPEATNPATPSAGTTETAAPNG